MIQPYRRIIHMVFLIFLTCFAGEALARGGILFPAATFFSDTLQFSLVEGQRDTFCPGPAQFPAAVHQGANICPDAAGNHASLEWNSSNGCLLMAGLHPGNGEQACLEFCDSTGKCDTLIVEVQVLPQPTTETITDTLKVGERSSYCLNDDQLAGPIVQLYEACQQQLPTYPFSINVKDQCVDFTTGNFAGWFRSCFVVCDASGICDTTRIEVLVLPLGIDYFYDTLLINRTGQRCLDTAELPSTPVNATSYLINANGQAVSFNVSINSYCVNYLATGRGTDTLCVVLKDAGGYADTSYVIVTSTLPRPAIITDTLIIGESSVYCLDPSELSGKISVVQNICALSNNPAVELFPLADGVCFQATGLTLGIDTACFVFCDKSGVCDTTQLILASMPGNVEELMIRANNDQGVTKADSALRIHILSNDRIPFGRISAYFLITDADGGQDPQWGSARLRDSTLIYQPDPGICDQTDRVVYVLCNPFVCDTATVTIFIDCPVREVTVYDGFSPNGDLVNDYFTIDGLEQYPEHELYIYNRWGTVVYQSNQYENNWDGSWRGNPLPDGVYYYVLEIAGHEIKKGMVVINR